ncbi:MAG: molybdate ABC transporter substrate-binding protein, partial [Solirubrobacteraceae bacterium]
MRGAAVALAAAALVAGCGDEAAGGERLIVSAAASLTEPLTECSRAFEGAQVRLSFGGSDELAAQIRQGVRPDVYAAANTTLPEQLAGEGLLAEPVEFATNELVIAVPAGGVRVASLVDLAQPGVDLVLGAESVPVGAYAHEVLSRLPAERERAILANVRSEEPDVGGVVGKVAQGAADAGVVYRTDIVDGLEAVELPGALRPAVAYGAGVVEEAPQPELARRYLDGMTDGACADALRAAGFGPAG